MSQFEPKRFFDLAKSLGGRQIARGKNPSAGPEHYLIQLKEKQIVNKPKIALILTFHTDTFPTLKYMYIVRIPLGKFK